MQFLAPFAILWLLSGQASTQDPTLDLSDRECQGEVLIGVVESAFIYASCSSSGSERIMRVSVSNRAEPALGPLRNFEVGFCGTSVVAATGPVGWVAKVEGGERHSVTWSLADADVDRLGIPAGARADGFIVRLKPGWRRSRSDSAWWGESMIVAQATTHDC